MGKKSGDMGMRTPPGAQRPVAPDSVPAREGEASVMSFVIALCRKRADDESGTIHMKRWGGVIYRALFRHVGFRHARSVEDSRACVKAGDYVSCIE